MATYKVPSQAASGSDTFSDALVGNQITTGSDQMTGSNFAIDKAIPEKDSKEFITEPFSEFVTLDDIGTDESETSTDGSSSSSSSSTDNEIKFNNDKNNADRALYGSLRERLRVAVKNIILDFPAAVYVDSTSPVGTSSYTAEEVSYNVEDNITQFKVQYSLIYNPLEVVIIEPNSNTLPETDNNIRNFFSSYTKYLVDLNDTTYNVLTYTGPNSDNKITLKVTGDLFGGATGSTENYIIRPNNGVVEGFYKNLSDIETVLLNRNSDPIYNAGFNVPRETNDGYDSEMITVYVNWPISRDGWNIQVEGIDYGFYTEQLSSLGEEIDGYKSNLVNRFLTSPQLHEFDTEEQKMGSILQIYGQSFDQVKTFIDNIAYMRNVSYDSINNLPDALLKNLATTLGLDSVDLFDETSLEQTLYTRYDTQYDGVSTGTNLIEAENEFYRRLLVNLAHLYKSKGTRNAIEFFLKFIGAPEPMIRLDEYVYVVNNYLPSKDVEGDISDAILGSWVSNTAVYNTGTSVYDLVQVTGSTTLTRNEYPVDETTGLPRKIVDPTGDLFFQKGAGWYRKTLDHRSPEILDTANSDLTSRVKTIKTMSAPFTYGEDYFDMFRELPGLDYGYDLSPKIDNKKAEVISSETDADMTMNRKNINVFLSGDRAIDYDIYRKSRDIPTSFGELLPQTGVTFAEFLDTALNDTISNSNMVKYDKFYNTLTQVYYNYQNTSGYTPYHYVTVEEFINRLSPYWVNIIDQFIPATTLWIGGNVIENGTFNRSKFKYIRPPWFDVIDCDMDGTLVLIPCPIVSPSPTPEISPAISPTPTPTVTPTPTRTVTPTPTRTVTPTPTRTVTPTPSVTPPLAQFTFDTDLGTTFTIMTNSVGGPVSWPATLSSPFTFPITTDQTRTFDNGDLFSAQSVLITLGGSITTGSCIAVYMDFGAGEVMVNNTFGTTLTTGVPIALTTPNSTIYPPVIGPNSIRIGFTTGCSNIAKLSAYNGFSSGYVITDISISGISPIAMPIPEGMYHAQSFTSVSSQTISVTVTGSGSACIKTYDDPGTVLHDSVAVSGSGVYNVDIPAASGGENFNLYLNSGVC